MDQWTDFKSLMGYNQVVYVTDQIPRLSILNQDGVLLARGRTIENAHNVYSNSRGDRYAVDTANQRLQKFARVGN